MVDRVGIGIGIGGEWGISKLKLKSKSTKIEIPKSISFRKCSKFRCCTYSNPSRYETEAVLTKDIVKEFCRDCAFIVIPIFMEFTTDIFGYLRSSAPLRQLLSIRIDLVDENELLTNKFNDLEAKAFSEFALLKKINIVINGAVPLLLKNSHLWIAHSYLVTPDYHQACRELISDDEIPNSQRLKECASCLPSIKVFIDVLIVGAIFEKKLKKIETDEDFKELLRHLMSKKDTLMGASVVSLRGLEPKEKLKH